ncbi:hypothetical protein DFH09DRAFT_1018033 [Mycena vulgaris]|nr:hypothetical protein DFH09DRAFT_1018033 [Mycena vulgaris]
MASPPPENPHTFTPTSPFDSPGADIILRSSDGAEFRVYRAILSLVSPFFQDMFLLPQLAPEPQIPIITVQEDSVRLDRALRFFYPGTQSTVVTLAELRDVLAVLVDKYNMHCLVPAANQQLERYLVDEPLGVYVLASTYRSKDVAIAAAKESLKLPLRVPDKLAPRELRDIPAATYHNLLHYHYLCGVAATRSTMNLQWITNVDDYVWFSCGRCLGRWWAEAGPAGKYVCQWFYDFTKTLGDLVAGTPGIDISLHESISEALKRAAACENCRARGITELLPFLSTRLIPKIKEAIDEVELCF